MDGEATVLDVGPQGLAEAVPKATLKREQGGLAWCTWSEHVSFFATPQTYGTVHRGVGAARREV